MNGNHAMPRYKHIMRLKKKEAKIKISKMSLDELQKMQGILLLSKNEYIVSLVKEMFKEDLKCQKQNYK